MYRARKAPTKSYRAIPTGVRWRFAGLRPNAKLVELFETAKQRRPIPRRPLADPLLSQKQRIDPELYGQLIDGHFERKTQFVPAGRASALSLSRKVESKWNQVPVNFIAPNVTGTSISIPMFEGLGALKVA